MKFYYVLFMFVSLVQADWKSDMLERSNQLYNETKDKTIELVSTKELSKEEAREQQLNKIWGDVFDDLEDGASYIVKLNSAPDSAWIQSDKSDIQEDINKKLDDIIDTLIGHDLLLYKTKIASLREKISENRSDILSCREKKIGAPLNSTVYTTKSGYDDKIKEIKIENRAYEDDIIVVKNSLKQNFSDIGVSLTSEQLDVLLSRVDGDDIIQMTLVMDVLKHITNQIMQLMKESREELSQAKKYYAMHLITLEIVVYIQQKYIDKVNNIYIPKIDMLIGTSENMIHITEKLRLSEENNNKRSIYTKNLEAQKLASRAGKLYKNDLIKSRNRMILAQKKSKANLTLSKNTYETVMLSVELYKLISQSQDVFTEVSKIQMPDIVPFENIQMQEKYRELTSLMQKE